MIFVALIASVAGMIAIAIWAYRHVAPHTDRLPMQWSADGTVNWRAPRLVAIAATPALMLTLIALIFVVINLIVDLLYFVVDPRLRVQRTGRGH